MAFQMINAPGPKNIVICCDGTGNQFGNHNSNVIKLFSVLRRNSPDQVLYYHPGVGTKGSMEVPTYLGLIAQKINKWHAFAYGYGMISNLANAYSFLMQNYNHGDKVFIFGFSRGAFTARTLCSFIYEFGLLENGNDSLIEYAMSLFINPNGPSLKIARNFKKVFGRECSAHFVGVWETVSSVGWIYDPLTIPYTRENPTIRIGRQALAIDERRSFFRPNLWGEAHEGQDFKQVWFAGAHSDVGGGYPYKDSGLANITLKWMLDEAEAAGLSVDPEAKAQLFAENPPDPNDCIHKSLHGIWWIPEYLPQPYTIRVNNHFQKKFGAHRGHLRHIPEKSLIHESVFERQKNPANHYHPRNLPNNYLVVST
jgi:uncharacterized protein (DUF2235 family)